MHKIWFLIVIDKTYATVKIIQNKIYLLDSHTINEGCDWAVQVKAVWNYVSDQ